MQASQVTRFGRETHSQSHALTTHLLFLTPAASAPAPEFQLLQLDARQLALIFAISSDLRRLLATPLLCLIYPGPIARGPGLEIRIIICGQHISIV